MTSIRSSMPSRLRQLLSGGSTIRPSIELDSEPPPNIKAFIDKVIQCPLQDIAIPLSSFRWEYSKGNFHHWRPLFLHFDTYFKTYLSCRDDLFLSDSVLEDTSPFPKNAVLKILRTMQTILENCNNKSSYGGTEHFKLLLASTDPEILIATLETLSALVKVNPSKLHGSGKLIGLGSVNGYLLSLAQGWGSKEEGLGLYTFCIENEKTQEDGLSLIPSGMENNCNNTQHRIGSTLYFELRGLNAQSKESSAYADSANSRIIYIPDLHLRKEDDLLLMKQCIEQYNIPPDIRFPLLTRIRYARAFRSRRICRLYSRISILSFIALVQSSDAHEELVSFFANEPEYTNELIRIVRSEETIPGTVRTLAMLALGAQVAVCASCYERARIFSGSNNSFAGGNRMILLNVLQRAVLSLNNSTDPASLLFVESLLQFYFLHIVSISAGGSNFRGSSMVPTFLPLLEDSDPAHIHLVSLAVKTLQKLMDNSSSAVSTFKNLGGVELLAQRLQIEVHRVLGLAGSSHNSMVIGESSRCCDDQLYLQKRLIKVLLKALGPDTYSSINSARSYNSLDSALPATLSLIFKNADKFKGDIYYAAVIVMSETIHKDPTCFSSLHEMGLPDAFLSSVQAGILPSSKALICVPNGIGAICLNAKGLETVKETSALRFLVEIFTSKKYVTAMHGAIVPLANAVEELLRHVSSLKTTGVDILIAIIAKIASFEEGSCTEKVNVASAMEMDSGDQANDGHCSVVSPGSLNGEGISNEYFIQLSIFHLMILLHITTENSETCRLFVEKSGIEALLNLVLRPSITQSPEGMSIALHSTMVFEGFTRHHSAQLAHAFCSSLRDHLKKVLAGLDAVSGSFLLDSKVTPDVVVFPSLFLVEFLLFLAASEENRWLNALLTEFGTNNKDVLEDIGRIHREVLWQIALHEDAKLEPENNRIGSSSESQQSEQSTSDTEEPRFNSFRQLFDPMFRRSSAWSVESQFFDLINMYVSRSTGSQRFGDGPLNQRFGANHHLRRSGSVDVGGSGKNEFHKERSYYISCCDMVKSLSSHISYLFQELGKAMIIPSGQRDDILSVSKSVATVFSLIALDHMKFGGHASPESEASISTKCRYFGKVIDFIDGILLDRPDSCNPVMLNCFYVHGVVQSVLTTFEATSQLLFAVNRTPASPMETDDVILQNDVKVDSDNSWIYGPLASYAKLMDHLVTSSFILSPFTKNVLAQALTSGDIPFPPDAETFVKVLQSMVFKAVLPVWCHQQFTDCSYNFITTVISIIKHVYSGVEVKNVISITTNARSLAPPNETTISTIMEMGFSRSRAEEALRQVGSNSVELAMEWLFTHTEEIQEEDELSRALAMSLGSSESDTKEIISSENSQHFEEQMIQLPPIQDLLSTCTKLSQMKENLAFPIRDLLLMICSQNDGQQRFAVITYIINHMKSCTLVYESGSSQMLSAHFHVLALVLNDDIVAREVASKNGLVKFASDLLSHWDSGTVGREKCSVPKWVTTAFLSIDRLLHVEPKLNLGIAEKLKMSGVSIDEDEQNKLQSALGLTPKHVDLNEQKRLIEIVCSCIRNELPSETMHAILQLCCTLTSDHSVALCFLDAGGLSSLLSLPTSCLFPGFDNVANTIIRHVLEDPQTLQQAMEFEIRHSLVTAANRHSNGRVTPRNFLSNLSSAISRDPVNFVLAARSVCQVEMVGERPYIVLLKDRCKGKESDGQATMEKDKLHTTYGKVALSSPAKVNDANPKGVKVHKKSPQSFIIVIEFLLDSLFSYVPPSKDELVPDVLFDIPSSTGMDIDGAANRGKGKAVVTVSKDNELSSLEVSVSLAKLVFTLKVLTEILLMYPSCIHIFLRRDADVGSNRIPNQRGLATGLCTGGIFHHILHKFLPCSHSSKKDKKTDCDWASKLATRASQFLVAACVRSTEARRRVFTNINCMFNDFVGSCYGFRTPINDMHVFVDLLNDILVARSPTGSNISAETSGNFIDVGLLKSFTRILEVLDLDHAASSKVVTGIIKAMELVTKEHVPSSETNAGKGENSSKHPDQSQPGIAENIGSTSQFMETSSQSNHDSLPANHVEPFNTVHQTFGGSEDVTDDMEHDQNLDGGFAPAAGGDYTHETSEDLEHAHDEGNLNEEGDDMSADEGDGDDDDGVQEHNEDDEDDGVDHLPDTDQDDREIDEEDEFDEEAMEEDDDVGDADEGVILRLEENINGVFDHIEDFGRDHSFQHDTPVMPVEAFGSRFDHIDVFGRDHSFQHDTPVMPVEVFGSRRQGRTSSIYNLLGRSGEVAAPSQHPLLTPPSFSLHSAADRQSEHASEMVPPHRSLENTSSRLETIFRTLRNGRHGHRLNLWLDDNQQNGGTNAAPAGSQGLEELLVSHLRRPTSETLSDQNTTTNPQNTDEAGARPEISVENNANIETENCPSVVAIERPDNDDLRSAANESLQRTDVSVIHSQNVQVQFEQNDVAVRDVEAVSQESSDSGATLGDRNLDVEIGSVDGHDDSGERRGSSDRIPLGEPASRTRRSNVSFGHSAGGASLHSITEISESYSREADQGGPAAEQQINNDAGAGSIDPAFLDALPEALRVEVLSAQQAQVAQPSNAEPQNTGDIDPEFLAALPPDIRAEVLAQQQAQRLPQSHELEGQPVEMDTVSIIATFPSELRQEVLLTSSDAVLANLPPALVAEAQMLRDRLARQYHSRNLFGMHSINRRGDTSRHAEGIRSSMGGGGGSISSHRSVGPKPREAGGAPLVDLEALQAMIRLLRVVQPIYKGQLQRLLLHLCAHSESRTALVKILLDMLILDRRKSVVHLNLVEPSYRLYGCQTNVMYSRPQFYNGVPPLVSRRVLETLTYLARNHPHVAKILLQHRLPHSDLEESEHIDQAKGKAIMVVEKDEITRKQSHEGCLSLPLLLGLLNQPLYLRSIAHLEQLLNLFVVIIDNAESKLSLSNKNGASGIEEQCGPQISSADTEIDTESGGVPSTVGVRPSNAIDYSKPTVSECSSQNVLLRLPHAELRLLCSLLACEGLTDNTYALVAEVMKKLVAVIPSHCHLFITELGNALHSLTRSAMRELHLFSKEVKALISTISSGGAAILRVLQALSFLVPSLKVNQKDPQIIPEKEQTATTAEVGDINASLDPLWLELSTCISNVEKHSDTLLDLSATSSTSSYQLSNIMPRLPAGSHNILPYIESFFVMCDKLHPAMPVFGNDIGPVVAEVKDASTSGGQQKMLGPILKVDEKHIAFVKFSEKHRKLLNAFVRQSPGLLEKSFSLLLKVPRIIDFDNKRAHFKSKIKHHHNHHHSSPLRISVRRAYILEDSYNQLRMRSTQELKGRLTVQFQGEEGIDAGGLTREWYQSLSRVIFDKGALLFTTVGNESTFQPNPNSVYQTEHLSYFKFVGRVVGKALFDGQLLDVHFTRSFYKHILGVKVTYHDIEAIDPDYFKNLKWMLENDISDILGLTFSIDADEEKLILYEKTEVTDYELIPGGRIIKVTEENKHQYVDLVAEHRLTTAIRPQINAFLEGFNELVSRELISIFHDKELELLISGLPDIDLDDMRVNTEYSGYSTGSQVIQWFWEVVQAFSKEDKARLLQFVTGTSKVPLEGFSALQGITGSQKFQIHKAYGSQDHLPSAHTCFNQLDLPEYPSKEHLQERLLLAIHEANEGFGFG